MATVSDAVAQSSQPLEINRVFGDPDLSGPRPRSAMFSPKGDRITYLQPKEDDYLALDLISESIGGGDAKILVDSKKLDADDSELSETERARRERKRIREYGVVEYQWDEQGDAVLTPVAGDLYLADATDGSVRRLTETDGDEIDAKVSPKGRYVGFVRDQDLYSIDLTTGDERRLTEGGGGPISNGLAEFVVQEEFNRFSGFWFSPNDQFIAYTRTDETDVPILPRPEINADGVTVVEQRYPRAGTNNATIELFILDIANDKTVPVDIGSDPDIYLVRADWASDGEGLYVQIVSRDQKRLDLLRIDPTTGKSATILTERSKSWINVHDDFRPLKNGEFLWKSERDGFAHLYLYAASGEMVRQVTSGGWPVRELVGVDEDAGQVFFLAGVETPIEQHLYRAGYLAAEEPLKVTKDTGSWNVSMNNDASAFIATFSDVATPPRVSLHKSDGSFIRWIEENALGADHPFGPYAERYPQPKFGTVKAPGDGPDLHYRIDLPVGFEEGKRYPAIIDVYGGPHAQDVRRGWDRQTLRLFQERGFVVFMLDNQGTNHRGVEFESALGGRFGDVEVRDQLAGLKFLKEQPFVDEDRVGVWGWSYGGFMTAMLMIEAPEAFAAGVSVAPVTTWRLYDTAYTERYIGMPEAKGGTYDLSSPLGKAGEIAAPFLLIHGMADDNVTFDNTTLFIEALQKASVPFDLMTYPGQRHGLYDRWATRHAFQTILDFFDRELGDQRE
ncbi:MAG: S9 family peptidase [Pseudomonadota bacterium]